MVNFRLISCLLSSTCFLLLLVAHCSHNWRTYHPPTGSFTVGLWTICSEKAGCRKYSIDGQASLEFTRAFMLVALVTSFMAVIWAIEWDHLFHCSFTFIPKSLVASVCNFIAGLSLLIGLVMFEIESIQIPEKEMSSKDWAFYLSCVNGALCLLTAFLDLSAYKCSLWGTEGSHNLVFPEHEETTETPTVAPALL